MDNYTWDLTIKQNPTQPNKYIDMSGPVTMESTKQQPVEELNLKQLNIDNTHFSASSNGETKASKDASVPVPADSKQGKSVSELS